MPVSFLVRFLPAGLLLATCLVLALLVAGPGSRLATAFSAGSSVPTGECRLLDGRLGRSADLFSPLLVSPVWSLLGSGGGLIRPALPLRCRLLCPGRLPARVPVWAVLAREGRTGGGRLSTSLARVPA